MFKKHFILNVKLLAYISTNIKVKQKWGGYKQLTYN